MTDIPPWAPKKPTRKRPCKWCKGTMIVTSAARKYHPDCVVPARRHRQAVKARRALAAPAAQRTEQAANPQASEATEGAEEPPHTPHTAPKEAPNAH